MIRAKLKFLSYAQFVSLRENRRARGQALSAHQPMLGSRAARRVSTPVLNNWLKRRSRLAARPHAGKPARAHLLYDAGEIAPPTFLISPPERAAAFQLPALPRKQLRAKFDYVGTPVRFIQRLRKREKRSGGRRRP